MIDIFAEDMLISVLMIIFMAAGIFTRLALGYIYQNMIRETDNMPVTTNKMLKKCKLKFENCYNLNKGMANVGVFVDKFLVKLSVGKITYEAMYRMSGQSIMLSVLFAGIGVSRGLSRGRFITQMFPYYIVSFLGIYLFLSITAMVNIRGKKRELKVSLVDYLENHLLAKMETTKADMTMLYNINQEASTNSDNKKEYKKEEKKEADNEESVTKEEIEALLNEFWAM